FARQRHPHPALSLSEGEGFSLIPRPRRGRGPQFELKGEALRRGLSREGRPGCGSRAREEFALDAQGVEAARQDEQALEEVVASHDELAAVRAVVWPRIGALVEACFGEHSRRAPVIRARGREVALHERLCRCLRRLTIPRALRLQRPHTGKLEEG